jgi:hypothetical protein
MSFYMKLAFLIIAFLVSACSTTPKLTPQDLLIPVDRPIEKPPASLSDSQVTTDVNYLLYALDRGYAGRDYMPSPAYRQMIQSLGQIRGPMAPDQLRDLIDAILVDAPDSHLHARFNGQWSKFRESKRHSGNVGNNYYKGSSDKPWNLEVRKVGSELVLLISITSFPFHESPVWNGFLDHVQEKLPKVSAAILDLRGNGGGDDTTGLQLAWIFHGKNYRYPLAIQHERKTPETQALYANMFAYRIAKNIIENKKTDEFVLKRYSDRKEKFEKSLKENTNGYSGEDQSVYEFSGKMKYRPEPFNKPVFILMDQRCASSCESTIDAFESYPQVKRVGENTAGYIHFGNVSPVILPNSKILVQIGTHYGEYADHRFIEKVGIKPDITLNAGGDALVSTIDFLKQNPTCVGSPEAKHYAVYLHGIDSAQPGEQEVANRKVLESIARKLKVRFALPRAKDKCGDGLCWGWAVTDEKALESVPAIRAAADACFPSGSSYGLLGFSSGGYLATKLFRACLIPEHLPNVKWVVTSGATMMKGPIEPKPEDLSGCRQLAMLIGTKDQFNNDPSRNYLKLLQSKHAKVEYVEFDGDHNLYEKPMISAIESYLSKSKSVPHE